MIASRVVKSIRMSTKTTLTFFLLVWPFLLFAQDQDEEAHSEGSLLEFFTFHINEKARERDSTLYPAKLITAPIINYSPETNLGFGVGAKVLFKMEGSGKETRTSNIPISALYTLENQFILFSGFEVFTPQERYMIAGNVMFQDFPRFFYGLGRESPEEAEEEYSFYQILFEPIFLKRAFDRHLFLGGGVRYNKITGVESLEDGVLQNSDYPGADGSTSVGVELASIYDSRDNLLNAKTGWYLEFTHGFYGEVLGGSHQFELTRLDLRHYWQPFRKNDDILAFQLKMHFSHGNTPLSELALFGSSEIMRGYYEGRFIDRHMIATQVEYRKNIKGRVGAVFFAGIGDVANRTSDFNFKNLRATVGAGLRFMIEKKENLNIRFDWGFGRRTNNYYLNIAEAF